MDGYCHGVKFICQSAARRAFPLAPEVSSRRLHAYSDEDVTPTKGAPNVQEYSAADRRFSTLRGCRPARRHLGQGKRGAHHRAVRQARLPRFLLGRGHRRRFHATGPLRRTGRRGGAGDPRRCRAILSRRRGRMSKGGARPRRDLQGHHRGRDAEFLRPIFMASHGRRGVDALLLGSETSKVLAHSKIPVLVYR